MLSLIQVLDANEFCESTQGLWKLIGTIVNIIQIAIPVIIILLGTIDLGKAVMAGKDDEIKAAQKMLIKRIIYGVLVFFVVMIVKAVFNLVADANVESSACWNCVATPSKCSTN